MRKPAEFEHHPVTFADAMREGLWRGVVAWLLDADTYVVHTDKGFYDYQYVELRLNGVDTPEVVGAEAQRGLSAKSYIGAIIFGAPVVFRTFQQSTGTERMSFNRYIADVYVVYPDRRESVAGILQRAGFDKLHPILPPVSP